ncbi:hypothetical protein EAO21_29280 [Klebsiella pneumoniae]|nr:hypothetical protein EAO21_29280 [Klebsiella pneumoniae]
MYHRNTTVRIVAGIKADGVEEWVSSRGGRWNGTTEEALKFAKQLRKDETANAHSRWFCDCREQPGISVLPRLRKRW